MKIEDYLSNWKNKSLFGERLFEKLNTSLVEGQSLYRLIYKAKISVDDKHIIIEKSKFFQTSAQNINDNKQINPNGDNYVCEQILKQLETEFFKDYNEFIDQEVERRTSP